MEMKRRRRRRRRRKKKRKSKLHVKLAMHQAIKETLLDPLNRSPEGQRWHWPRSRYGIGRESSGREKSRGRGGGADARTSTEQWRRRQQRRV
jgi:hypothetical protein